MLPVDSLLLFASTGALVGFIAGLVGIGGGLVMVPILLGMFLQSGLPLAAALPLATGTSLAAIVSTAALSANAHRRNGAFDVPLLRRLLLPVTFGAVCGPILALYVSAKAIHLAMAALFALIAVSLVRNALRASTCESGAAWHRTLPARARDKVTSLASLSVGAFAGIAGIGGNTLMVPLLARVVGVPFKTAIGVSAGLAVPLSLAGAIGYGCREPHDALSFIGVPTIGSIHVTACVGLALGSACTVRIGAAIARKIDTRWLQRAFALVLAVTAAKLVHALGAA